MRLLLFNAICLLAGLSIHFDGVLGEMLTFTYRTGFFLLIGLVNLLIFFYMGLPKDYIRIMRQIERVPDFRNEDGEAPILVDRQAVPGDAHAELWSFESCGLAHDLWIEKQQELENAFDVCILEVGYGKDNTCTTLKVLPHPGPWPEILPWQDKYLPDDEAKIVLGLNRSYPVIADLMVHPHYLVAGETGSGKSVLLSSILWQSLKHDHRCILVDMKHFVDYTELVPRVDKAIDTEEALQDVLKELTEEMHSRLKQLREAGCANISVYNKRFPQKEMTRIVLVIDEYTEAINKGTTKEEKSRAEASEGMVAGLCRLARAAGINVVIGLQRGGQEVHGQIRSNTRVILGRCNDNLSIVMTGSTELGRMIPASGRGMFVTDEKQLFKGFVFN